MLKRSETETCVLDIDQVPWYVESHRTVIEAKGADMEQDEQKRTDEEIRAEKEANDSELTDADLENVAGGGGHTGNTGTPSQPNN
jgi:hypothetical protein